MFILSKYTHNLCNIKLTLFSISEINFKYLNKTLQFLIITSTVATFPDVKVHKTSQGAPYQTSHSDFRSGVYIRAI